MSVQCVVGAGSRPPSSPPSWERERGERKESEVAKERDKGGSSALKITVLSLPHCCACDSVRRPSRLLWLARRPSGHSWLPPNGCPAAAPYVEALERRARPSGVFVGVAGVRCVRVLYLAQGGGGEAVFVAGHFGAPQHSHCLVPSYQITLLRVRADAKGESSSKRQHRNLAATGHEWTARAVVAVPQWRARPLLL
jgi:hypothetical protein